MSRISTIPWRQWEDIAEQAAELLSNKYRTSYGTQKLYPIQAALLCDAYDLGGAFGCVTVGHGKTVITALAPTVLRAKRPLLLLPSKLVSKTHHDFDALRNHWQIYPRATYPVWPYSSLGVESGADILEEYRPDLLICDEAHKLKNLEGSGVARRVNRYMIAHPETNMIALSGTFLKAGIRDYAHIMHWCLGARSPLPIDKYELQYLASCTDVKPSWRPPEPFSGLQTDYGAAATKNIKSARNAVRDRIRSAPGCIFSTGTYTDHALIITPRIVTPPPELEVYFKDLRELWQAPDGWYLEDARQVWLLARQMALGFYHQHIPRPPEDWALARRNWTHSVRQLLETSTQYDTVGQVVSALRRGKAHIADWAPWDRIKDTYKPRIVTRWLSEHMLHEVVRMVDQHRRGTIVWVEHREFGKALAELTGWPYYRDKGIDIKTGNHIMHSKPVNVIASVGACGEGLCLEQWSRAILTSPSPTNGIWEQTVSREHRQRQTRDVEVEYIVSTHEHVTAVKSALAEARLAEQECGQQQKIMFAGLTAPKIPGTLRKLWSFKQS